MKPLRRVAVLGAGTMGSRIAAHFANAGVPALLLDIVVPGQPDRNAAALKGLDTAMKQKPAAFFTPAAASLIQTGNFEDDLGAIRDCDWILEAVAENLDIKRNMLKRVEAVRAPVAGNLYESVPGAPWRERFVLPEFMRRMVERGWLGDKTGQGFYKRVGPAKEIYAIDWKTLEYHPAKKPKFPSVEAARNIEDLGQRLRTLIGTTEIGAPDRAGSLLWKLFRDHVVYAAGMVPEISDRIVEIDRAMRWGYANK